jgi:SagB-type dehydrogenase family enzyme
VCLSKRELGEFLFRCARLEARDGHLSRPYAAGGAIYELEIYVLVDRCYGLAPGLYYYDGSTHTLGPVSAPNPDTEAMLVSAMAAMGGAARPQVHLTIASRFARVANKYESMAYAVQLKNCGVLIATLYAVATAMGLAPCAIGAGDSDRFARVTGMEYAEEGAIGEFVLSR